MSAETSASSSLSTAVGCPIVAPFDYTTVSADTAASLRAQAERIRSCIKRTTAAIIEIGRDLRRVKDDLGHGQFTAWVEAEVGIAARTAQRWMLVAELADKNDTVSLLPPTIAYKIAPKTTSPDIVSTILAKAAAGETVPDSVVKKMIADDQWRRRQERADERLKARRKNRTRHRREHQREVQEEDRPEQERRERANIIAADLVEKFGHVAVTEIASALDDYWVRESIRQLALTAVAAECSKL
jgi:hypothetical protein